MGFNEIEFGEIDDTVNGFDKMHFWQNILSAKHHFSDTSLRRNGFGEMGFDDMDFGEMYRNLFLYIA